eukprot:639817-Rhodomonas_salina.4
MSSRAHAHAQRVMRHLVAPYRTSVPGIAQDAHRQIAAFTWAIFSTRNSTSGSIISPRSAPGTA